MEARFSQAQLPPGGKDKLRVELRDQGLKGFVGEVRGGESSGCWAQPGELRWG